MSQSENTPEKNLTELRKWESRIQAIKEIERQKLSLGKALEKALGSEGTFRVKILIKDEKKRDAALDSNEFEDFLAEKGIIKVVTKDNKETFSTVADFTFHDDFIVEFLLFWYNRMKSAEEKLINRTC